MPNNKKHHEKSRKQRKQPTSAWELPKLTSAWELPKLGDLTKNRSGWLADSLNGIDECLKAIYAACTNEQPTQQDRINVGIKGKELLGHLSYFNPSQNSTRLNTQPITEDIQAYMAKVNKFLEGTGKQIKLLEQKIAEITELSGTEIKARTIIGSEQENAFNAIKKSEAATKPEKAALDFEELLKQIRTLDTKPEHLGALIIAADKQATDDTKQGELSAAILLRHENLINAAKKKFLDKKAFLLEQSNALMADYLKSDANPLAKRFASDFIVDKNSEEFDTLQKKLKELMPTKKRVTFADNVESLAGTTYKQVGKFFLVASRDEFEPKLLITIRDPKNKKYIEAKSVDGSEDDVTLIHQKLLRDEKHHISHALNQVIIKNVDESFLGRGNLQSAAGIESQLKKLSKELYNKSDLNFCKTGEKAEKLLQAKYDELKAKKEFDDLSYSKRTNPTDDDNRSVALAQLAFIQKKLEYRKTLYEIKGIAPSFFANANPYSAQKKHAATNSMLEVVKLMTKNLNEGFTDINWWKTMAIPTLRNRIPNSKAAKDGELGKIQKELLNFCDNALLNVPAKSEVAQQDNRRSEAVPPSLKR